MFMMCFLLCDGFVLQDPHHSNEHIPSLEYVIPDRSDEYCVPPLPFFFAPRC